jgi:ribosomal protein S18 acetylase RimI-like enzyme
VTQPALSTVPAGDAPNVVATIVSAFADDPVERWLWPEEGQYLAHFPRFVEAFGGAAYAQQTVWTLGGFSAVALWLSPGSETDGEAIVEVLNETVSPDKHDDTFAVLEQMGEGHPDVPHWYLPWLAVEHGSQGGGLGGELLRRCLNRVDESGLAAFLETPNPRTVGFYEGHGFDVTAIAQAGACPPMTLMMREAR